MMQVNSNTKHIDITRGDTILLYLKLKNYTPDPNTDSMRFALAKADTKQVVLVKTIDINTLELRVDAIETKQLEPGNYDYDIQLTYEDGIVTTFIESTLTVYADIY